MSLKGSRVLEVRGRTSGEPRTTVVNLLDGRRRCHLVAPRGTTQWVRNLRAQVSGHRASGRQGRALRRPRVALMRRRRRPPANTSRRGRGRSAGSSRARGRLDGRGDCGRRPRFPGVPRRAGLSGQGRARPPRRRGRAPSPCGVEDGTSLQLGNDLGCRPARSGPTTAATTTRRTTSSWATSAPHLLGRTLDPLLLPAPRSEITECGEAVRPPVPATPGQQHRGRPRRSAQAASVRRARIDPMTSSTAKTSASGPPSLLTNSSTSSRGLAVERHQLGADLRRALPRRSGRLAGRGAAPAAVRRRRHAGGRRWAP